MTKQTRLVSAGDDTVFFYHATLMSGFCGIQREGLTPNTDREPNWDGYPVDGRLYLARDEQAAGFYAEALKGDFGRKTAMLRCPASSVTVHADDYGNPGDMFTKDTVPPENIEMFSGNGWTHLSTVKLRMKSRPECAAVPDFTVGSLSVFRKGNEIQVTDDGCPLDTREYENCVARIVVDDGSIVEAAMPRGGFEDFVVDVLNWIALPATGRAKVALNCHGIRFSGDRWSFADDYVCEPKNPLA